MEFYVTDKAMDFLKKMKADCIRISFIPGETSPG